MAKSNAQRQQEHRIRQREEKDIIDAEEAYVARELTITSAYAKSFNSEEKKGELAQRQERSEAYARWRFRGFLAGEIQSL